jgi:hypothetical protein
LLARAAQNLFRLIAVPVFLLVPVLLLPAASYKLKSSAETVAWGYFWADAKPVLTVKSGDTVEMQSVWQLVDGTKGVHAMVPKQASQISRKST